LYKFPKPWYIQKSNFYSETNFLSTFGPIGLAASRPIRPFGPPGPVAFGLVSETAPPAYSDFRPIRPTNLLPPTPEQSMQAVTAGQPHATPMVGRDHLHRREQIAVSPLLHFPIKWCPSPLFNPPVTGTFNSGVSYPGSEKMKPKPLYVCPGCSNHTYSNNMVNRYNISINYRIKSYKMTRGSKRKVTE
jgi:hypothetical protein